MAAIGTSYQFNGIDGGDESGWAVSNAGDVTGDGVDDLIIGARLGDPNGDSGAGETYLISGADLAVYDAADGTVDGIIELSNVANFCFMAGTQIATATGETAVETLQIGDMIRTATGALVPVKWIGRQTVYPRFGFDPKREPVCITVGALGAGLPTRDLYVSADHGMILSASRSQAVGDTNNQLVINASALVNGGTIRFVPCSELPVHFVYYHIETEAHDVILANGAAAETFIDVAGRKAFDNYDEYQELYGAERIIPEMDRPRISSRRLLPAAIKARLGHEPAFSCDVPLAG